jgi:hypothetical protein
MLSWANVDFGPDEPLAWLIGQAQTEARVDLHLSAGLAAHTAPITSASVRTTEAIWSHAKKLMPRCSHLIML